MQRSRPPSVPIARLVPNESNCCWDAGEHRPAHPIVLLVFGRGAEPNVRVAVGVRYSWPPFVAGLRRAEAIIGSPLVVEHAASACP
jgi:hypothetical protein